MEDQSNILIIDLEATCDKDGLIPRHDIEIIEIGAVIGAISSTDFVALDDLQIYVKPMINPGLTTFCTELTGIQQTDVDNGVALHEAFETLGTWLDSYDIRSWGSWGKFDLTQISMEAEAKETLNPLAELQHFNLKQLFARRHKHRVGLSRAVSIDGISVRRLSP